MSVKSIRYAVLQKGSVRFIERHQGEIGNGKVLVRVRYCGICGTDLQKYRSFPDVQEWGHEILGLLPDATPVVIRTSFPCGNCSRCRSGKTCVNWRREVFSGFAEGVVLDRRCIIPVPSEDPVYALAEPLNVSIQLCERLRPRAGESCAIVGNAAIALLSAYWLRKQGLDVAIFSRNNSVVRQKFAEILGIQVLSVTDMETRLREFDLILDTAPYDTVPQVMEWAGSYTRIAFNGIGGTAKCLVDFQQWHFHNLTVCPVFPHPQGEFQEAIHSISADSDILRKAITQIYPIDQLTEALAMTSKKEYIKVLIEMKRDEKT